MTSVTVKSHAKVKAPLAALLIIAGLLLVVVVGIAMIGNNTGSNVLAQNLSEPLGDVTSAKINIHAGAANLTIDSLNPNVPLLASAALEYLESQGTPDYTMKASNGQANLMLKTGSGQKPGLHLPWEACNGETNWQIHLNPTVSSDITAYSGGGNLKLDLSDMVITYVSAETGGGNVNVVLPDNAANLSATARTGAGDVTVEVGRGITGGNAIDANSGAGNVVIQLPEGTAARVHATSGMGKVIVDSRFNKIDEATFQTADFDRATDTVEINIHSGAGNVNVTTK